MASIACVVRKATSGGGANRSVYEVFIRDSVTSGNMRKVGEYHDWADQRGGLPAAGTTEFGDAGNTLAAITGVTDFGVLTDL